MKSNVMPSIVRIEGNELKQLVSEVKETVAKDVVKASKGKRPVFGIVDLWNINRKMRGATRIVRSL